MDHQAPTALARRAFLRLLGGGAAALSVTTVLAACGSPAPASAPTAGGQQQAPASGAAKAELKIGLLSGYSGPYAAFGPDMYRASELYLEQHGGTLGGLQVTTIQEDEGATSQDALTKTRKLIQQDKVDLIMGVVSSANALAIRDVVDQAQVPTIITNANANEITGEKRSPYIFRAAVTAWQNGASLGHWVAQNVGSRVIAMAPDYTAGQQWIAAFKQDFESVGGSVIDALYPPLGTSDYAPYLAKVKPQNPDGVWAQFAGSDAVKFNQQWTQYIGTSVRLCGGGLNQQACDQVGKSALSMISESTAWEPRLDIPTNKAFVEAFQKKYNTLPQYGQYHYDAMALVDKILQSNGGDKSPAALVKGFDDISEIDSVRGVVKVDPETRGLIVPFWRAQPVEDNGAVTIKVLETLGTFAPFKRLD
jgi:branched-chain amino acid transport system substrate-binding protein